MRRGIQGLGAIAQTVLKEDPLSVYTLIEIAKLNGIDPQAWLTDVLARITHHPINKIDELLPWRFHKTD